MNFGTCTLVALGDGAADAWAVLAGASAGAATTTAGAGALSAAAEEGSGVSAAFGEGGFVATDGDAGAAGVGAVPLDTRSVVAAGAFLVVAAEAAAGLAGVALALEVRWFQVLRTSGAAAGASLPSAEGFAASGVRGSRGAEEARIVPYMVAERGLPVPSIGPRVSGELGATGVCGALVLRGEGAWAGVWPGEAAGAGVSGALCVGVTGAAAGDAGWWWGAGEAGCDTDSRWRGETSRPSD